MRSNRSRFLVAPAIALVVSFGLGACGSSSSDTAAGTVAAGETAAAETPAAETVAAETEVTAGETSAAPADSAPAAGAKDIVDTAVAAGSFTTLAKLLGDAGLIETLKGPGPFTVS